MNPLRQRIAESAAALIGVRFAHLGRDPRRGVDCVGVVFCALQAAGVIVEDCRSYQRCPSSDLMLRELRRRFVEIDSPGVGDVIVLHDGRDRAARHVGVMIEPHAMVCADEGRGVRRRPFLPSMMRTAFRAKAAT